MKQNLYFEVQNWFSNSKFLPKYVNFYSLVMTVPINISEPPMAHTQQNSLHRSKGKKILFPWIFIIMCLIQLWASLRMITSKTYTIGFPTEVFSTLMTYVRNTVTTHRVSSIECQNHLNSNIIQKIALFTYWMTKERDVA